MEELQEQIERLATAAINRPTHINQNNQRINNIINKIKDRNNIYIYKIH